MTTFSTISRNSLQTSTILTGAVLAMALSQPAYALPAGGNVVAGQAAIATSGTTTNITQATNRALIEWSNFDIGQNETANFIQPSSAAIALNRVVGATSASQINGALNANGNVIIVNSQGVMFGAGAAVNVGGLVATTADIDNNRFMNGDLTFDKAGNPNAVVSNSGNINVADGGLALLVGPSVTNDGLIQANLGKVQLASGDTFAVDMYGDGLLSVQASGDLTAQLVKNSGQIEANGGQVLLTAAAAQSAVESVINMDGLVQANSIGSKGGKVVLSGAKTTLVAGKIDAKGTAGNEKGGEVNVLGGNVGILTGATIDVSGNTGGGTILIGGDYQGQGITPTAQNTVLQTGASLFANALLNGNGGKVIVWADNNTFFYGNIEAKGGAAGGNGGFVETSGKEYLDAFGSVDASAANGQGGTWLLDPNNINITNLPNTDNNVAGNPNFTTTSNNGRVSVASIEANLNAGTSVIITTGTAGLNTQPGNITVSSNILKNAGTDASLTLNAHNNITVNLGVSITSTSNKLNVNFNAAAGKVDMDLGSALTTNGGNAAFSAGTNVEINGAINTGDGTFLATATTGNIRLRAFAGTITSTATGDAITLAALAGNFVNDRGADALTATNGRWLVYSTNPANDTIGGLVPDFKRYSCTYGGSCPTLGSGDGLLYSFTPTLTITPDAANGTYGQPAPSFTYTLSGYLAGDDVTDMVSGSADFTTPYMVGNNVGTYDINVAAGTLASEMGYGFTGSTLANGLTIDPAALTVTANDQTQTYGTGNSFTAGFSTTGLYSGDTIDTVDLSTDATNSTSGNWNAGAWTITIANALGMSFDANNYTITYTNGALNIGQKDLIVSAVADDKVYDATRNATVTLSNDAIIGDVVDNSFTTARFGNKNVGTNKNVTVNGISISGADSANYNLTNTTATDQADITPAALTITANNQSQVYGDGNVLGNGYQIAGLQGGETVGSVDLATDATLSSSGNWNAGSWSIIGSNASGGTFSASNYTITFVDGALTVLKKNLTATVVADDKVYDATRDATVTFSDDRIGGDVFDETFTTALFDTKDVGTNKDVTVLGMALTGTDSANYNLTNTTATDQADITPAALTITANDQTQTYGDGNNLVNGFSTTGLQGGETVGSVDLATDATNSTSGNWNVGTWGIMASNATGGTFSASNYTITFVDGALVVTPKDLIVSAVADDKIYDGNRNATVTLSNDAIMGDVVDNSFTTARFGTKNVGTNKNVTVNGISISGADAGNYNLTNTTATDKADITPAALTITANDQTQTYGDGNNLTNGYTAVGLVGGETIGSVDLATDATNSTSGNWNAGTWGIMASNPTNNGPFRTTNYTITFVDGALVVTPKALNVSALADDKVYDGTTTATVTFSDDRIGGDVFDVLNASADFDDKNVGVDKLVTVAGITISGTDAANYTQNTTTTDLADITPATLFIDADDQTKVYGSADPFLSFGFSGFVTGDDDSLFTGGLSRDAGENVAGGPYNINQGSLDAGSNYTIDYTGGVLTITPYTLSVLADDQTKVYGDVDPTLTFTFGTLQNGDDASVFSGDLTRDAGENVADGPYNINQGALDAGSNYTISYTGGLLRITPATLFVTGDDQFITLGDNIPPLTFAASGFKFSDGFEVFTGGLRTVPRETLPGTYGINRGTLEANSNYVIDYTRGFLTIQSPFDVNNTSEQTSDFAGGNFRTPGSSTLLAVNNGGGATGGGLGGLAPAAGGENPGNLEPSAGGDNFALIQCDENNPCDIPQ
ncbi:MAG: MBG domain-containing protein [Alphaproteobacteria bacterium]|nr:MBG domain-containing protein [Alphaproteobacteria bacterium]